ncbi:MAG TPA: FG-GAP-like repeat-containing protein [bacterium]
MLSRHNSSIAPIAGLIFALTVLFGCSSGGNNPVTSDLTTPDNKSVGEESNNSNHALWGEFVFNFTDVYDDSGNLIDIQAEVVPLRTNDVHVEVTKFVKPPSCADCVKLNVWKIEPGATETTLYVYVELKNPTSITGYDVRGIIYPPSDQVRLLNRDGLTTLHKAGMPEDAYPYKAFNFDTEFRPFGAQETHGRDYIFTKQNTYPLLSMIYKIDASWPSNADEAVSCFVFEDEDGIIYPQGSNYFIIVDIMDWQSDISTVELDLSEMGHPEPALMDKLSDDPPNHKSRWQYHLTEGGGAPAGMKTVTLIAHDPVGKYDYMYDFDLPVVYDNEPPIFPEGIGIYDHISGPELVWAFYKEAWDISYPIEYIFYGNSQSSPFDGTSLKVVSSDDYTGYTQFGQAGGAPSNEKRYFGIRLKDAQGWIDDNMLEYSLTRYSIDSRWTFIKGQPAGQDGIWSGPTLGDVNGDGVDDIAVGNREGFVQIFEGNGTGNQDTIIWEFDAGGEVQTSPCLVDLNNDNKQDVVVASDAPIVYALNGATGLPLWEFVPGDGILMRSSPAIAYINGDTTPDVVVGTGGGSVFAVNGTNGEQIWEYVGGGGLQGAPAVADVNGDTIPDVCIGGYDTTVHMIDGSDGSKIWTFYVGPGMNNIDCPVVLSDVNGDDVPDAIFGARKSGAPSGPTGLLYAINGATGDQIWLNDTQLWGNGRRGVAPVHLNDDGIYDFVVTLYTAGQWSIYGINGVNGQVMVQSLGPDVNPEAAVNYSAPIVGDFTGDGKLNAIYARWDGFCDLVLLDGEDLPGDWMGKQLFKMQVSTGTKLEINGTPAVGDVDGDGELEMIVCNMRGFTFIHDLHAPVPESYMWAQHQGNRWHTGTPDFVPDK